MASASRSIREFAQAFEGPDVNRFSGLIELTDEEFAEVVAGVHHLPDPRAAVCQLLLDEWDELDSPSRVAALLVLANALAASL
jgi:hypothetical protein